MDNLKEKIIYHVFEFLETGDIEHSKIAKEHLKELAKKYHVKIKKQIITNTKNAFKEFILNNNGFDETIPKLYNSL
jgi:hypothetical protein